jgi:Lsr2
VAQKIQTLFLDDLDGSAAGGTIRFGLDGTGYEIDLNAVLLAKDPDVRADDSSSILRDLIDLTCGQRARSFCRLFRAEPVIMMAGACEGAASPRAGIFPPRAAAKAHR